MQDSIRQVPISQIEVDLDQPRKDMGDLEGLMASIGRYGIIQPPVVTTAGVDKYRILAGERRFTAARELGLASIPVIVRSVKEHERCYLQLVENLQREDLDPFEQAQSFRKLMSEYGLSEQQLGARVGKSQDHVSRALTIADNIPEEIRQEYYATSRKVAPSVLLEIARADTILKKMRMWQRARKGRYTVRQARAERANADGHLEGKASAPRPRPEMIQLANATVTVQCARSVSPEGILAILREATHRWETELRLARPEYGDCMPESPIDCMLTQQAIA
jgi:ParB family chromosome partitioning protein